MSKIYVNPNKLISSVKAVKKNEKRKRPIIMNFRVTPEEKAQIDIRIRMSGMSRQEYYHQSMLRQQIITYGNIRTFSEIRLELKRIGKKLQCMSASVSLDDRDTEAIRMIVELINGLERVE